MSETAGTDSSSELKILLRLEPEINQLATATLDQEGYYKTALKASLAKSYEFCLFAETSNDTDHAYFSTGALRGICEDLIVLSYLKSFNPNDRDEIVSELMCMSLWDGLSIQYDFFAGTRPWQPVPGASDADNRKKAAEDALTAFKQKYAWKSGTYWLTTREMAAERKLESLYKYLFATTSKLVHFNPHVLLRIGWTKEPMKKESLRDVEALMSMPHVFSTKQFGRYYAEFNRVYGTYLFVLFCQSFKDTLSLNETGIELAEKLAALGKAELRWPEVVTFEELNLLPPRIHPLRYALRGKILMEEVGDLD